jgi:hypothetical protein
MANCRQCTALRLAYERKTAARLKAEADYLSAVYSGRAIKAAREMAKRTLAVWLRAEAALHNHERSHARVAAAC